MNNSLPRSQPDIVERLRSKHENWALGQKGPPILLEAADRIEELTRALEKIHQFPYVGFNASRQMILIAGAALSLEGRGSAT